MTAYEKQELHSVLSRLPPGPWHAKGDTIFAGDRIVCVVMEWQNDDHIAEQIARLPDLLAKTVSMDTLEEVERALTEAEKQIAALEADLDVALDD